METYNHNAIFQGVFVTQLARITKFVIPGVQAVYVPLPEHGVMAYAPNNFHDMFYRWEFYESYGIARFESPLLLIISAN